MKAFYAIGIFCFATLASALWSGCSSAPKKTTEAPVAAAVAPASETPVVTSPVNLGAASSGQAL